MVFGKLLALGKDRSLVKNPLKSRFLVQKWVITKTFAQVLYKML